VAGRRTPNSAANEKNKWVIDFAHGKKVKDEED
jgi:hypothetical protein